MPIDSRLIGQWITGTDRISIETDSWWYSYDIVGFTIAADDATLALAAETGQITTYERVGVGNGLYGTWFAEFNEPEGLFREEVTYSASGTFSTIWHLNGQLDTVHFGYCAIRGSYLHLRERRARVETDGSGTITLDKPYGADEIGSYEFDQDDRLLLTLGGKVTIYTRL